ncbi:hypothetical protein Taro_032342 [Colocasia esculenta]|uniref:RNase H type-1 domain-containing protein n=1 Tax=Colocasia esculenta TaxID=4460 RepID=A0A843VUL5_COLES|nr:hypothetical protein [Colocasia esculenta]
MAAAWDNSSDSDSESSSSEEEEEKANLAFMSNIDDNIIGDGKMVNFLNHVWIGQGPLSELLSSPYTGPPLTVREVVENANHPVQSLIPCANILQHIKLMDHEDCCVWTANPGGSFTTSSAYHIISSHGVERKPLVRLWHHNFYKRASLFYWKLLYRAIPVDSRISDQGIALVSRCSCCTVHCSEDLNHLFISSDLAHSLWGWVTPILDLNVSTYANITTRLWQNLSQCNPATPAGFISLYASTLVIWEIWRARCRMRFDGERPSISRITQNIRYMINSSLNMQMFKNPSSERYLRDVHCFSINLKIKEKSFKLVRWILPDTGLVLNVDGASKGNPGISGGGGCIRDSSGNFLFAFAHYYGFGSSLVAEVRALCDGLRMAAEYGFPLSLIYSDSVTLVTSISTNKPPSWECLRWWRVASSYIQASNVKVVHSYRQVNQVADALASVALTGGVRTSSPFGGGCTLLV